jgi:hypothetical protein
MSATPPNPPDMNASQENAPPGQPPEAPGSTSEQTAPGVVQRLRETLQRAWIYARPGLHQIYMTMKIWAPFLMNPRQRSCQVRYWARECRVNKTWSIILPDNCWACGTTEDLADRQYDVEIRGYDSGAPISMGTIGISLCCLLLACLFLSFNLLLISLLVLVIGGVLFFAKSWTEQVRLVISTCPQHADELRRPDIVLDENELFLFLPTETLALATRAQQQAKRRRNDEVPPTLPGGASPPPMGKASSGQPGQQGQSGPDTSRGNSWNVTPPPELPPIKMAGDEESAEDGNG